MGKLFAVFTDRELLPIWILALMVACCFSVYCFGAVYFLATNEGYLVAATPTLTPFATPFPTNTSYPTSTLTPSSEGVESVPTEIMPTTAVPTMIVPSAVPPPTSTPIPTAPPTETPVPAIDARCTCEEDNLSCDSFLSSRDAQHCYEYCQAAGYDDPYVLDGDNDGFVCEYSP